MIKNLDFGLPTNDDKFNFKLFFWHSVNLSESAVHHLNIAVSHQRNVLLYHAKVPP